MKKKLTTALAILVLAGLILNGIFGIAAAVLIAGIGGTIIGLYYKDKSIWKPSLIMLVIAAVCITTFIILLINSDM